MTKTNCTFITALYNIGTPDSRNHSSLEKRIDLIKKLFSLDIPIIAFIDPEYRIFFDNLNYQNVNIIYRSLETFTIWKLCKEKTLSLPLTRNTGKDTNEFLILMNMKIDFVKEALDICSTPIVAWIDGSIFHIVSDEERVKKALEKEVNLGEKVRIPGPVRLSERVTPLTILENQIQWKFCGGYFQGKKEALLDFYEKTIEVLQEWKERGKITWEVNIWVELSDKFKLFEWVYGDHNDSMLLLNE